MKMNHKTIKQPKDENLERIKKCPRFDRCSANICPLDSEVAERTYLYGEDICPFTIKKRRKGQKGIKTQAPGCVLKVIPESNLKMLNKGNQKRHALYKRSIN